MKAGRRDLWDERANSRAILPLDMRNTNTWNTERSIMEEVGMLMYSDDDEWSHAEKVLTNNKTL